MNAPLSSHLPSAALDETPHIEVHHDLSGPDPAWALLESDAPCHAFSTRRWLHASHRWIGEAAGEQVCVVVVRSPRDGAVWMVLPLAVRRTAGIRRLVWMGTSFTDYQGPLLSTDCPPHLLESGFVALWDTIQDALPDVDLVQLERQPLDLHGQRNPFARLQLSERPSAAWQATLAPDWQAFLDQRASRRTQRGWQRKARKLATFGAVTIDTPHAPVERRAVLHELFAQKSDSYRRLGAPDLFADPAVRGMLLELSETAPDLVHLSRLTVGDRVQATHLGLVWDGTMYSLFPTYRRNKLARLGAGTLLRLELMRQACEMGLHTFDFTVGDEAYKQRWTDRSHVQFDTLMPVTLKGSLAASTQRSVLWASRQAKQTERTYERAKAVRRWARKAVM